VAAAELSERGGQPVSHLQELTQMVLTKIRSQQSQLRQQWLHPEGTRTHHLVIDNLLPADLCDAAYRAFPRDGNGFFRRKSFREKKLVSANLGAYDPILSDLTFAIQDSRVVSAIADIVGFEQIEPDPKLYAGGLSMMLQGDFLNPHIDNSHDADRGRFRRLNLLYYVSPGWKRENGGNLELWNDSRSVAKTIVSAANRLVVMETNKTSWHSVSKVVVQQPRCCVSNYYYWTASADATEYFHVTSFTGRPEQRVRRLIGHVDNAARNALSRLFKLGRGKNLINKPTP
jgi:Rps23 Pro-64 3,4-dihydroxylase Tpa1-like proline 4-hydroxylase